MSAVSGASSGAAAATASSSSAVGPATALLDQAFRERQDLRDRGQVGAAAPVQAAWNGTLAELRSSCESAIPKGVEESWGRARHRASCGLLPSLRRAWASVDCILYVWDYGVDDPPVLSASADAIILAVSACEPREGIFPADLRGVLVVASQLSVSFLGLKAASTGSVAAASSGAASPGFEHLFFLEGYSVPVDGFHFHRIRQTGSGRIFLVSGSPRLFELCYAPCATWTRPKCWLAQYSAASAPWLPWTQAAGRLRLLECKGDYVYTVDDLGCLRHWSAAPAGHSGGSVDCLGALTAEDLERQALAVSGIPVRSAIVRLLPSLGGDGRPCLHAVTSAGQHLRLASSDAAGEAAVLRLVAVTPPAAGVLASSSPSGSSAGFFDGADEPCAYADGVLLRAVRWPGATKTEIHISVTVERCEGAARGQEMQGVETLEAEVLDIVAMPEQEMDLWGGQSFILLLPQGVRTVTLLRNAQDARRPPSSAEECRGYLARLEAYLGGGPGGRQRRAPWMWSMDDARIPAFEEQQRLLRLGSAPPSLELGRWFNGLLLFLADVLQPVWDAPLLRRAPSKGFLGLYRKHGSADASFAIPEAQARHLLARLAPVLNFVQQGAGPAPGTKAVGGAAARSCFYTREQTSAQGAQQQVRHLLEGLLEVVNRVQQVLGLLSVLQAHQCGEGVLRSSYLSSGCSELITHPLRTLVASQAALAPVVRLCTALVIETQAAEGDRGVTGRTAEMCKQLQELCPSIFAQVDLSPCMTATSLEGQAMDNPSSDMFRHYIQCMSADSQEDQWKVAAKGMQVLAREDPLDAANLCCEKLLQLPRGNAAAAAHARALLEAFVSGLHPEAEARNVEAIHAVLARMASPDDESLHAPDFVANADTVIFATLLESKPLRGILEALIPSNLPSLEEFLRSQSISSRHAGDCLWKLYLHRQQDGLAAGVLLQLAERPGDDCVLRDRIACLRHAKDHAAKALRTAPQESALAEVVQTLELRVDVATRVQTHLQAELKLLAADTRIASEWRESAERYCSVLEELCELKELYRIATQFSLFHIGLVILDVSKASAGQEIVASSWASLLFAHSGSPYEMRPRQPPASVLCPLLTVRQNVPFFLGSDIASASQGEAGAAPVQQMLQARIEAFVEEFSGVVELSSPVWDMKCFVALLEYANCTWLHACETAALHPSSRQAGGLETSRAWVALRLLRRSPFKQDLADIVAFYAEMLAHLPTWIGDLQGILPPEAPGATHAAPGVAGSLATQEQEDLRLHLSEVVLCALSQWVELAEAGDPRALADFRGEWLRTGDGLLAGLGLRLSGQQADARARRLLPEVLRLEAAGRRACGAGAHHRIDASRWIVDSRMARIDG
eukprot:TRINITY_DN26417_c0_g1_i2.p1 TRINITY_DN26417_c0_g1~~TRINITY_DN26417_c0_g1_i2.p1  ORF type:complete len:1372 (+),score=250.71 TRINITY_DN26417_c0_g1_i2:35-4117(+)